MKDVSVSAGWAVWFKRHAEYLREIPSQSLEKIDVEFWFESENEFKYYVGKTIENNNYQQFIENKMENKVIKLQSYSWGMNQEVKKEKWDGVIEIYTNHITHTPMNIERKTITLGYSFPVAVTS